MFNEEASEQANKKYPIPRVYNELDVARNRKYEEGFKDGAKFGYNKANEYAKTVIQDLLNNSDEYARQRAMDFLKEVS